MDYNTHFAPRSQTEFGNEDALQAKPQSPQ